MLIENAVRACRLKTVAPYKNTERIRNMFGKGERRKRRPYFMIAVFTLAATSVVSAVQKGKRFVKEKAECIKDMMKG